MPVRSREPLLAGMAALLGLCIAGAGCQSSAVHRDSQAVDCGCGGGTVSTPIAALGTPTATGPRGPLAKLFRKEAPAEPTMAQVCVNCSPPTAQATPLRPVPVAANGAVASAWQPVQRVRADMPLTSAVGLERPQAGIPVVSTSASQTVLASGPTGTTEPIILPAPTAVPLVIGDQPPPGHRPDMGKGAGGKQQRGGKDADQLGMPRRGGNGSQPAGYPQLPPTTVTHPPEAPREFSKRALSAYVIEPPDILIVRATSAVTLETFPIDGQHLVRPDGTISLGTYGDVFVAGRTLEGAKDAIARVLQGRVKSKKGEPFTLDQIKQELQVDVGVYNSKFYYVITDGGGYGEQVVRLPITGNETVLDAVAAIQGLPAQASKKKIWIARATPADDHGTHILPVDWCAIAQRGSAGTNYQLFPGDRIYVHSDPLLRLDTRVGRFLSPIERIFGTVLLGSTTVNSIRTGTNAGTGGGGVFR